jgi:hypothetical protein
MGSVGRLKNGRLSTFKPIPETLGLVKSRESARAGKQYLQEPAHFTAQHHRTVEHEAGKDLCGVSQPLEILDQRAAVVVGPIDRPEVVPAIAEAWPLDVEPIAAVAMALDQFLLLGVGSAHILNPEKLIAPISSPERIGSTIMPVTTGMKGEGFYDRNSSPQWAAIEAVLPWLKTAVSQWDLRDSDSPVAVIDYACSEGRNSIAMIDQIVPVLRQRTSRPIQVFHSDLPTNNFNKLFVNLATGDRSLSSSDGIYSAAVAGSMFDQLMPPQSVNLATTFNAIGFLDHLPDVELPDYILPMARAIRGPASMSRPRHVLPTPPRRPATWYAFIAHVPPSSFPAESCSSPASASTNGIAAPTESTT